MPIAGVAGCTPCIPIDGQFLRQFVHRLAEQMSQNSGPEGAGRPESIRRAGGGEPHRQTRLQRPRQGSHRESLFARTCELDILATPEALDLVYGIEHHCLAAKISRRQHEVARLPAGRESNAHAAVRQVVHHRPLLGNARRVMQGTNHAAGTQADALGYHCQRGGGLSGIRVEAAELMEMPLRRPDRRESMPVGKAGAFQQQPVLVVPGRVSTGEVHQAELDVLVGMPATAHGAGRSTLLILMQHHAKAACKRPEQLQHRNVE